MNKTVIDIATGERTLVPLTAEEIAAMEVIEPTAPTLEEQVAALQAQLNALLGVGNGD